MDFTISRPNVFLTSFFRSGSTHVKETLLRLLPGYSSSSTVYSIGPLNNDNTDINPFAAQVLFPMGMQVFHQHTPGSNSNVATLKMYKMPPVIQLRNILDSMVSVRELLATGQPQHLGVYYPENFHLLKEKEQLWWCAKNLPQWYFKYYVSWKHADIPKHYVWYDEYYKDQVKGVRGILDHVGISALGSVPDEAIDMASQVINPGLSRFKFGRPGRGREILSDAMIDDVMAQARVWPEGEELIDQLIWRGYED